jgi:two-component system NtrC family sensor kinase
MAEEKVLIVDDSIELIHLLENILPYGGYHAVSATTGEEGLRLALDHLPDLILVDLELPDITGLRFLESLNQQGLAIPTIMMTGYGSEGVAARALRLGASGYLIKPFTTEEVLSSVEKALAVSRLRREKAHLAAMLDTYSRHFRTLSAIGQAMIDGLDQERFFQRIVEAALFITRAERCLLALVDRDSNQFRLVAVRGKAAPPGLFFFRQAGDARLQTALSEGASVRLHTTSDPPIALQTGETVRAVLQVPLRTREQVIGLLSADRQTGGLPFGKHDEQMLAILADYAVIAVAQIARTE